VADLTKDPLKPSEVAEELDVSPAVVYAAIKHGRLRAARLGTLSGESGRGTYRIYRDWIRNWLEAATRHEPVTIDQPKNRRPRARAASSNGVANVTTAA
jgi:excisionase family DNA binding protein